MSTPLHCDRDPFRILLYRNDATELFLETTPGGLRLPVVAIPRYARVAEELTAAIKESWNLRTYSLFPLPCSGQSHSHAQYQVCETWQSVDRPPAGMDWHSVLSLSVRDFEDREDFVVTENSLTTLAQYRRGELPGAFGKPGWLRMVAEWIEGQVRSLGLRLNGNFRQLNASAAFSLIRFETDGPALWFKAVGEPNIHEHCITLRLASAFPEFLPRILASRPEWNAWLSIESEGSPIGADSTEAVWELAAENLALLQISSFGRGFELIQAGCKDLRPCTLRDRVHPFFDSMTQLMERQTKVPPKPLSRDELLALGREITSALQQTEDAGVPNALGHLDLNAGNVLVSSAHCVFLDWAEAYVGPPFFSFQYLLEYWRRLHNEDLRGEDSLLACYAKHWTSLATSGQMARTLQLVPLLAVFAYAANGLAGRSSDSIRPETAAYFRSLTRRMEREVHILRERSVPCPS